MCPPRVIYVFVFFFLQNYFLFDVLHQIKDLDLRMLEFKFLKNRSNIKNFKKDPFGTTGVKPGHNLFPNNDLK